MGTQGNEKLARMFSKPWRWFSYIGRSAILFIVGYMFYQNADTALHKTSYFAFGLAGLQLVLAIIAFVMWRKNKEQ